MSAAVEVKKYETGVMGTTVLLKRSGVSHMHACQVQIVWDSLIAPGFCSDHHMNQTNEALCITEILAFDRSILWGGIHMSNLHSVAHQLW